jgi:hypothetical protein
LTERTLTLDLRKLALDLDSGFARVGQLFLNLVGAIEAHIDLDLRGAGHEFRLRV